MNEAYHGVKEEDSEEAYIGVSGSRRATFSIKLHFIQSLSLLEFEIQRATYCKFLYR